MRPLLLLSLLALLLRPLAISAEPADIHAGHDHQAMTAATPALPAKPANVTPQPGQSLYVCPMHPNIVRSEPGNCPLCGMALEPLKQSGAGGRVEVSAAVRQSLGLTTATAAASTLWRYIETLGEVRWDERTLVHIHSRANGWLERLVARNSGDFVKKGELLYEIYAPDLVAAQNDFLNALTVIKRDSGARSLYQRARLRLELLGMNHAQIDRWNIVATLNYLPQAEEVAIVLARVPQLATPQGREQVSVRRLWRGVMHLKDLQPLQAAWGHQLHLVAHA